MSESTERTEPDAQATGARRWLVPAVILGLIAVVAVTVDIGSALQSLLNWIDAQGVWAPVVFMLAYVVVTVVLLPPSLLTVGGGVIFGVAFGSLYVFVGANVGAVAAFLIGRHLAQDAVQRRVAGHAGFSALTGAIAQEGWKVVVLTRLSPVFPFGLQNYAYSVTGIRTRDYVFGTLIGMIPGIIMYTYIGSIVGDIATLGSGERDRTTAEWVLYGVGLLATVVVTVWITRRAQAALARQTSDDQ